MSYMEVTALCTQRNQKQGDFFDVSAIEGNRPEAVKVLGGGVETFLTFLKEQA